MKRREGATAAPSVVSAAAVVVLGKIALDRPVRLVGLRAELAAAANRYCLPGPGGIGAARVTGKESETPITRSPLTALTQSAAIRNTEVAEQ